MWDTILKGLNSIASNGQLLKGIGAVANAWGSYDVGKRANKIAKEQLEYDRKRFGAEEARREAAQGDLESALEDVYGKPKKKKKDDLSLAFETLSI